MEYYDDFKLTNYAVGNFEGTNLYNSILEVEIGLILECS